MLLTNTPPVSTTAGQAFFRPSMNGGNFKPFSTTSVICDLTLMFCVAMVVYGGHCLIILPFRLQINSSCPLLDCPWAMVMKSPPPPPPNTQLHF